jgi:hypothetical protein
MSEKESFSIIPRSANIMFSDSHSVLTIPTAGEEEKRDGVVRNGSVWCDMVVSSKNKVARRGLLCTWCMVQSLAKSVSSCFAPKKL